MKRSLRSALPLTLVGALVSACATSPTGRKQLVLMPKDQMAEMGAATFQQMKQEQPVVRDDATTRYVRCVAERIAEAVPAEEGGPDRWEVEVFQDETPNAFALPGGKIGVHTGMLSLAESPDQLAAVVGHEVGHVLARHGAERVSQNLVVQGGLASLSAIMGDSEKRGLWLGALGVGAQFGVLLPFSRTHETEADKIGQQLMARAGFDPSAAVELWQNMAQAAGGQAPPEFASTHPAHDTRISNLREWLPAAQKLQQQALQTGSRPACRMPASPTAAR